MVAARAAQQALEGQLASAQEANRALSASKGMLQSTMLEQLDLVKTKLVASERANARLKQQVLEHQLAATQQQAELLSGALRSAAAAGGGTMGPSPAPSPNPKPQVPIAEALDREILIRLSPLRAAMRASAAGGATAGADVSSSRSSTSSALLAALAASGLAGPGAAEGGGATPAGSLPPFPAATKAAASQKPLSPHDRHADGANKTTGSTAAAKFFFG